MTIQPGNYDLTIYQGASFSQSFTWKDHTGTLVNLTGYSARLMARASLEAAAFITLTNANGGIVLGGNTGVITLLLSDEQTALISQTFGIYDLELETPSGQVIRLLEGKVNMSKEVTR
jgi:hypothetical protein